MFEEFQFLEEPEEEEMPVFRKSAQFRSLSEKIVDEFPARSLTVCIFLLSCFSESLPPLLERHCLCQSMYQCTLLEFPRTPDL